MWVVLVFHGVSVCCFAVFHLSSTGSICFALFRIEHRGYYVLAVYSQISKFYPTHTSTQILGAYCDGRVLVQSYVLVLPSAVLTLA